MIRFDFGLFVIVDIINYRTGEDLMMVLDQLLAERFDFEWLSGRVDELTSMALANRVPRGSQIEVMTIATNGVNQLDSIAEFFDIGDLVVDNVDDNDVINSVLAVLDREVGDLYGVSFGFEYSTRSGDFSLVFFT